MNTLPHAPGIYKITCIPTGKFYVGSAQDLHSRWGNHRSALIRGAHGNLYLQSAWNKYGEQSFTVEILELVMPWSLLDREQYWLDKLKAYDRTVGFNLTLYAESPMAGLHHTEEAKRRIGRLSWDETERVSGFKGKIHSPESRQKMAVTARDFVAVDPCGNEYQIHSMRQFCIEHDLDRSHMIKVARGNRKQYKGWRCRYV